jgi:predicted transcriptional regulator
MTTLLSELNFLSEAESEIVKTIKNTAEFKKAAKLMKFISTPKELQNGTLVFDTAIPQPGRFADTSYVLKIYADGQVREQVKNGKTYFGSPSSHYRIGKPQTHADPIIRYRDALNDIIAYYNKKKVKFDKTSKE